MKKNDIIIGAALNYNHKDLSNFVVTLRKQYKNKILFFVSKDIDFKTLNFFKKYNVSYLKIKVNPRQVFKYRYKFYLDYLKKNKFDRVMVADTRDVIFQKNPFNDKNFSDLCFFQEDKKIKECGFNSNWIRNLYGKDNYNKIKNNKILCSGTSIGSYINILDYLKKICAEIKKTENTKISKQLTEYKFFKNTLLKVITLIIGKKNYLLLKYKLFGDYTYIGTDQGNHNFLIYSNKLKNFRIFDNKDGYIATIGNANLSKYSMKDGVYNSKGIKFSVIHQYDRIFKKNGPLHTVVFEREFRKYLKKLVK
jgi:hypothetical protein